MKKYIFVKDFGEPNFGSIWFKKGSIVNGSPAIILSGINVSYFSSTSGTEETIYIPNIYLDEYSGDEAIKPPFFTKRTIIALCVIASLIWVIAKK